MRCAPALALLAAAALPLAAHADSAVTLDFSIYYIPFIDADVLHFTITDPAAYTDNNGAFEYTDPNATYDGYPHLFTADFTPNGSLEHVFVNSPGFGSSSFDLNPINGIPFLTGDPSTGEAPTITPGFYTGQYGCFPISSLKGPIAGLPPTLAFLQISGPPDNCIGYVTLNATGATPPNSVTPEPSTLALLTTGLLGTAGLLRRRFHA